MKSVRPSAPPNAHAVTFGTGSSTTSVRVPRASYRCTAPPPQRATHRPSSSSIARPSGAPVQGSERHERPAAAERARVRVEVEGVDAPGRRVAVVDGRTVTAPLEAVGDGDAGQDRLDTQIGVEAVERPRVRGHRVGHRAAVEAALRVAAAVVHADRLVGEGLRQRLDDC